MRASRQTIGCRSALIAVLMLLCLAAAPAAGTTPRVPGRVLYGVTIDRIAHLAQMRATLAALPDRPTVRVVFDRSEPPMHYASAAQQLAGTAWVMGELLDSSQERAIGVAALKARARAYLHRLGTSVSVWELGNELNGNWTGPYAQVAARTRAAFSVLGPAHATTAITLYANDFGPDHCGDGPAELTPVQFARRYLSARLRAGLDYLLLSYYPTQCDGVEPTSATVATHLEALHALFPHARLGFGEVGLPHAATRSTVRRARQIMRWAYALNPRLPYYAGGYFWWFGAEDALRSRAPLRRNLRRAFRAERRALAPRTA